MERDWVGVTFFLLGLVLLIHSVMVTISGSGCETTYETNPNASITQALYYKTSKQNCSGDKLNLGAGIRNACREYTKCMNSTFSWNHFPYIRVIIALIIMFSSFDSLFSTVPQKDIKIPKDRKPNNVRKRKDRKSKTDPLHEQIVKYYLEQNPTPETTREIIEKMSDIYDKSVVSIRQILIINDVYVKVKPK